MHERRTKGKYFRMWSMHMKYWHCSFFSHVFAEGRAHFESELFVWLRTLWERTVRVTSCTCLKKSFSTPIAHDCGAESKAWTQGSKMFVSNKPAQCSFSEKRRKKVKRYTCMNTNCIETTLNFLTMRVIFVPIYIESIIQLIFYWLTVLKPVKASVHQITQIPLNFLLTWSCKSHKLPDLCYDSITEWFPYLTLVRILFNISRNRMF